MRTFDGIPGQPHMKAFLGAALRSRDVPHAILLTGEDTESFLAIARAIQSVRPAATIVTGRSGFGKRTKEEIGIHAIRMGNLAGEHEVLIGTNSQTITLKHETHSRALFAEGALAAAEFLIRKPAGLYSMQDMLADD